MKTISKYAIKLFDKQTTILRKIATSYCDHFFERTSKGKAKRTIFVSGVQRSGTNMLMKCLNNNSRITIFNESNPKAFDIFIMKDESIIKQLTAKAKTKYVAIKALHEAHMLHSFLESYENAQIIWLFRHYHDVVNSNVTSWPGRRNQIENVIRDRNSADWRGLGMTNETHELICSLYRRSMNDESAQALFWLYRNQLFFDQNMHQNANAIILEYEQIVSQCEKAICNLCKFIGVKPEPKMWSHIHQMSIRKNEPPNIMPHIRDKCEEMHERLRMTTVRMEER